MARRGPRTGMLLFAFAFAVMAEPVSSVAYAVEAALRALHGDLGRLVLTVGLVLTIILVIQVNYHQLITRFPEGGGSVAAAGVAFGEGWSFLSLGALVVDFVLTIALSVAAAASAVIAYFPHLQPYRVTLAAALCCMVASATWFGHLGRSLFAAMVVLFILVSAPILVHGFVAPEAMGRGAVQPADPASLLLVLLSFPVAMAAATGIEGVASSVAQLGQLDVRGKASFGHVTLWLTFAIQGTLSMIVAVLAVHLSLGIPRDGSTLIANEAKAAVGRGPTFAAFQLTSLLLLMAAASSAFQAGPGLLKALARTRTEDGSWVGVLNQRFGIANRHHTPYWGVALFLLISLTAVVAAGGQDQRLVLFYAVAVFVSFLFGLLALAKFAWEERRFGRLAVDALGIGVVIFTLLVNLRRGYPIVSIAASLGIAGLFGWLWIRQGRPRGIREVELLAEREIGEAEED
jgi:hypothetical protein